MLLTICAWGTALSQSGKADSVAGNTSDCAKYRWRANNTILARALECELELHNERERHVSTRHLLELCNLNVTSLEQDKADMENIIAASERNEEAAFGELSKMNLENQGLKKQLDKEERRKKRWRGAAGTFAGIALVLGLITLTN